MQFTPTAQHHIDQAAAALTAGDYNTAHHHLDNVVEHGTDQDRILLAFIVGATRHHCDHN
jgi:hypothetical protein